MYERFSVGDRVQLRRRSLIIPAGSLGVICYVFLSCNYYDVAFDGQKEWRLIAAEELKRVEQALQSEFGAALN